MVLHIIERPMQNFLPLAEGTNPQNFCVGPGSADTRAALAAFSPKDADRLDDYYQMLGRVVAFVRDLLLRTPPANLRRARDLLGLLSMGHSFRKLSAAAQSEVHELFTRSAGELLDGWFESDAIKALLGFDAVVGAFQSPYSSGSGYVLLHHSFGETNGKSGVWGHAIGGMGSITQAMAREAPAPGRRHPLGCWRRSDPRRHHARRCGPCHGIATAGRTGDQRESHCRKRQSKTALYPRVDAAVLTDEFRARVSALPLRVGDLSHECGPIRTAALQWHAP